MKYGFLNKIFLISIGVLLAIAVLISFVAWCLSDSGRPWMQSKLMRSYGKLTWHALALSYSDDWVVETVSRPEDGAILIYGFWKTDQKSPPESASLVLKHRNTGELVSFVITSMSPEKAKLNNFNGCIRIAKCHIGQSFLGLNTPNVTVPVDGGKWVVFERYAMSVLVLNPGHVNLGGLQLRST